MVILILGSKTDLEWGQKIAHHLKEFDIEFRFHIASAHKTPLYLLHLLEKYEKIYNPLIYICVAGRSNALGGFVDAQVIHPVINCPPKSDTYAGLDILSSLRMPTGVAAVTVLEPDLAAMAAAKMLCLSDKKLEKTISNYQRRLKRKIVRDDKDMND